MTDHWYAISAYNEQTLLGFGSEDDADVYVDLLNVGRDINHFHARVLEPEDCAALDNGDDTDGFALDLAIDTIRESRQWAAIYL